MLRAAAAASTMMTTPSHRRSSQLLLPASTSQRSSPASSRAPIRGSRSPMPWREGPPRSGSALVQVRFERIGHSRDTRIADSVFLSPFPSLDLSSLSLTFFEPPPPKKKIQKTKNQKPRKMQAETASSTRQPAPRGTPSPRQRSSEKARAGAEAATAGRRDPRLRPRF